MLCLKNIIQSTIFLIRSEKVNKMNWTKNSIINCINNTNRLNLLKLHVKQEESKDINILCPLDSISHLSCFLSIPSKESNLAIYVSIFLLSCSKCIYGTNLSSRLPYSLSSLFQCCFMSFINSIDLNAGSIDLVLIIQSQYL